MLDASSAAAQPAAAAAAAARPNLAWTPEVAQATDALYRRVARVIPKEEWPALAPTIHAINQLKRERGATILAHNYQTPDIFHCVADIVGDSLRLAQEAAKTPAKIIVQCGVHFMAETSKLLCPDKIVLLPDERAGCSLAASITGQDVRNLRKQWPGVPVVSYVNTSAEVKAETDICATSSNAVRVVESLNTDKVLFLPDEYLALNVAAQTQTQIIPWHGRCEVHEEFTPDDLRAMRLAHPDVKIIAHPECSPATLAEADFSGSTAAMIEWARTNRPKRLAMITECSMSDNVAAELPDVDFIRPCNLCPHMKRITLQGVLDALITMRHQITIPEDVAERARLPIQRMIALG